MKSQNSEIYFICTNDIGMYWYGKYCKILEKFYWSYSCNTIQALDFVLKDNEAVSTTNFDDFAIKFHIIHQQTTPFNLAYLQTYFPEYFI